jgi:hypothetical protein
MSLIRDFIAGLARAGNTFKEIKGTTEAAYGKNSIKTTQIYEFIRAVKEGKEPWTSARTTGGGK